MDNHKTKNKERVENIVKDEATKYQLLRQSMIEFTVEFIKYKKRNIKISILLLVAIFGKLIHLFLFYNGFMSLFVV